MTPAVTSNYFATLATMPQPAIQGIQTEALAEGAAMSGLWDRIRGAVEPWRHRLEGVATWLKGGGGAEPREPMSHYYIANPEVIRLSLAIAGLENFLSERPSLSASEAQLLDAVGGWLHAFPGYSTSQREVTGVLLALNRWEMAELWGFSAVVEGAILLVGLRVPHLMPAPMCDRIQNRGEELRWDLSLAVQQSPGQWRRSAQALGVFASNHEVWSLHVAVNALKVVASKLKPDFEIKRFLFDLESALIPAGRPDQALRGVALDLGEEEKERIREAERAVRSVTRFLIENGPESSRIRWGRELDKADELIEGVELLLTERLSRGR